MIHHDHHRSRRKGAATVETAVILIPLVMIMFGVFEYGRLLMAWNLLDNSAREGCRFALANNTNYSSASLFETAVTNTVTSYMGGQNTKAYSGFTVAVSGTHNGTAVSDPTTLVPGDMITVTVTGTYKFMDVIPYVKMPTTMSISSAVTMICEGGA